MKAMKTCATFTCAIDRSRLRPTREKRKDGIGGFRADDRRELFPRRAPNAGETAERRQQRAAAPRTDAGDEIELRSQVAHRPPLTMERDREAVRLVADALDQQQRGIVRRQRNRILAIAREEQLLLLRDADEIGRAHV